MDEIKRVGRTRLPDEQKAVSKAHSFRPVVLRVLDAYAKDQHTTPSQIITRALHKLIPEEYWH
jgi:hypothetical protein